VYALLSFWFLVSLSLSNTINTSQNRFKTVSQGCFQRTGNSCSPPTPAPTGRTYRKASKERRHVISGYIPTYARSTDKTIKASYIMINNQPNSVMALLTRISKKFCHPSQIAHPCIQKLNLFVYIRNMLVIRRKKIMRDHSKQS
jgi:hypothetical protein